MKDRPQRAWKYAEEYGSCKLEFRTEEAVSLTFRLKSIIEIETRSEKRTFLCSGVQETFGND